MMTTRDLFEQASLDVLGLLDEDERREFDRALRAADPAVQAQIRREQLRMTDIDQWLPAVAPPAALKSRTLSAVSEAIVAVRQGRAREHVRSKWGPFSLAMQRNVSPLWRAASLGLIGGVAALGYVVSKLNDQVRTTAVMQRSGENVDELMKMGGGSFVRTMISPRFTVKFNAGENRGRFESLATLYVGANDTGYLLVDLPSLPGGYRLVAVDDDGKIGRTISAFEVSGGRQVIQVASNAIPMGSRLAILPASSADTLASAVLIS